MKNERRFIELLAKLCNQDKPVRFEKDHDENCLTVYIGDYHYHVGDMSGRHSKETLDVLIDGLYGLLDWYLWKLEQNKKERLAVKDK